MNTRDVTLGGIVHSFRPRYNVVVAEASVRSMDSLREITNKEVLKHFTRNQATAFFLIAPI